MPLPTSAGVETTYKPPKPPKSGGGGKSSSSLPSWSSGTAAPVTTTAPAESKPAFDPGLLANLLESLSATAATADTAPFDPNAVASAKDDVEQAVAERDAAQGGSYIKPVEPRSLTISGVEINPEESRAPTPEAKITSTTEALTDALRAQRLEALGSEIQGPHRQGEARSEFREAAEKVDPMTQEEYDDLLPKQRAAVDFNTLLVSAVRRDIRLQDEYDPNKNQLATYEGAVENVLGEGNGSDLYAPETMALLRQIDFKDSAADLDDFLSLDTAITAKDIKSLKTTEGPTIREAQMDPVDLDRYQLTENLATSTQLIENELAHGLTLMQDIQSLTAADRFTDVTRMLGGIGRKQSGPGVGYDPTPLLQGESPTLNANFMEAFDTLAAKGSEPDEVLNYLQGLYSPKDFKAFMGYVDNRSKQAERYGLPLSENPDFKFPEPGEFRVQLGLEKGADNGGR